METEDIDQEVAELHKQVTGIDPAQADEHDDREADPVEEHDDDEADATGKVDAELDAAATDAERDEIRRQRRESKKMRRDRAKAREAEKDRTIQMLQQTVAHLNDRVARTENVTTGTQLAALDAEIGKTRDAVAQFKNIVADATTKGDGVRAAEATEHWLKAQRRQEQLEGIKAQATQPRERQESRPLNPAVATNAASFVGRHKWYAGAQSQDMDSRILTVVDNSLAEEGWNPATPEYWSELEKRAAKVLPHRFGAKNSPPQKGGSYTSDSGQRASPVAGAGGGAASTGGKAVSYSISAERVKAMKDAGIWDDPKARDSQIKAYKEYDRQNTR